MVGCDTHDMVVVHRVFRREFGLLPSMVAAVADGDVARAGVVGAHAGEMISALDHHHRGEDELIWPRLRDHIGIDSALVDRMEAQHDTVARLLASVSPRLERWVRTGEAVVRNELRDLFLRLHAALVEHLDDEERVVLPLVERTLTAAQWAEVGQRGMASMRKSRLLVFLGHILADASPREREGFLRHVPLPGRVGYQLIGHRRYRREIGVLRRDLAR